MAEEENDGPYRIIAEYYNSKEFLCVGFSAPDLSEDTVRKALDMELKTTSAHIAARLREIQRETDIGENVSFVRRLWQRKIEKAP